jgi:hypothetical protein
MLSEKFPEADVEIGKGQPEYFTIHAKHVGGGEVVSCWVLSDEEIETILKTRRIWYHRLTFGQPFQPMRITTEAPKFE